MIITQKNGKNINLISPGPVDHTINDVVNNVLNESALLYVEEPGTVKVTFANGKTDTLTDYDNYPAVLVTKVWATGTTLDASKIKLFE